MKVKREVWIESPRKGVAVSGSAYYCLVDKPKMMQLYTYSSSSDRADATYRRFSDDNGRSWSKPELIHTYYKKGDYVIRHHVGPLFLDPEENRLLLLHLENPLRRDNVESGFRARRIFYQVSNDGGETFTPARPIVEKGKEFSFEHPLKGVFIGKNSASIGGMPIKTSLHEVLLPLSMFVLDDKGELYNPYRKKGAYTFTYVVFLLGKWLSDSEIEWESSQIVKIDPSTSTRGLTEPTVAELDDRRTLLCICRGSNSGAPHLPGYKWMTLSKDGGRTWSEVKPLRYSDGGELYSPSSLSRLIRHSNGRLYWIANITSHNPKGNSPRYPLVIAEIDEKEVGVKRDSVRVIDTRRRGESEFLQLSNFGVYEDRETNEIVVTLARLFPKGPKDWTAPCVKYTITLND